MIFCFFAAMPSDLPASLLPAIHEIAALLACARRVLFITGAGVSANSGLLTYRGCGVSCGG
jgi:hypothetical protein